MLTPEQIKAKAEAKAKEEFPPGSYFTEIVDSVFLSDAYVKGFLAGLSESGEEIERLKKENEELKNFLKQLHGGIESFYHQVELYPGDKHQMEIWSEAITEKLTQSTNKEGGSK